MKDQHEPMKILADRVFLKFNSGYCQLHRRTCLECLDNEPFTHDCKKCHIIKSKRVVWGEIKPAFDYVAHSGGLFISREKKA